MNNEIIVVKQLPVIVEQLQTIKAEVTEKINYAMSLVCDENTVKEVKSVRADLNKEFAFWEDKRKEVKRAVISPYEQFEAVYKDCITEVFKKADRDLKTKIDSVEAALKAEKEKEVCDYFEELCQAANIDFLTFGMANIKVTLSASMKSLKEQAKAFVDRVCDDLNLIQVQEHKDEVLFHYKKPDGFSFLNVSKSITFVAEKHKVIEAEKAKEAERQAKAEAEQRAAKRVDMVVEKLTPPTAVEPPVEEEKILQATFTIKGTLAQLKEVKNFIIEKGIEML